MKKISVVILNWNGRQLLEEFLPSVVAFSRIEGAEVVVADNCSTDDSISFVRENYPAVRLICLPENYGYADGYNKSLAQVEAEYVVLLNSDVEVTEGWLEPIISFLDENPDVAGLQPKLLAQKNKHCFEYAGAAGGFIDKYGYPFCRGRIFDNLEEDGGQYDQPIDVFWATGACLAVRLKDYFEAGGLDASFFAHMEEIDLCWRLNARGKRLMCLPQSVVYHVGGATLSETSPHKTYLNFRNNLLMLYKNLPDNALGGVLRMRRFLDLLAALQMLLLGKRANAQAVLKAQKDFKKIKPDYKAARNQNLAKTIVHTIPTIYNKSLLWNFYAKGRKVFSSLRFR
ncbi:GT2 family glycosyltransferase [Dysgonomonas sp. PH5-45]|uniref:glycosyltransferase family 2 protein n=1 Tax=unclassified Dysgonomonas TaxID=2630389 RepID=UPI0024758419|nr:MULTISPECIES: glycosyltransferase family 2 protein [unclassified Dysgonomonas]MDH6355284.1 GT2 family glycosyltransferase [Dysgonomonas sp. PH5-45]MDH6388190.1 GT2 family glycosyltransferase [Dysgonomonas sp. PH5-37]